MPDNDSRRTCGFCDSSDKMSHEHLWPEWLEDVVPRPKPGSLLNTFTTRDGKLPMQLRGRSRKIATQTIKRVCEACNTGWMSDLEGEAKHSLAPLIRGESATVDHPAQRVMAIWATKMVMVHSLIVGPAEVPFGPQLLSAFARDRRPPATWIARCLHYQGDAYPVVCWLLPFGVTPKGMARPSRPNAHRSTIVVGRLVIQVIGTALGVPQGRALEIDQRADYRWVWPLSAPFQWPLGWMNDAALRRLMQPPGWSPGFYPGE
jgi:hypothetical protein